MNKKPHRTNDESLVPNVGTSYTSTHSDHSYYSMYINIYIFNKNYSINNVIKTSTANKCEDNTLLILSSICYYSMNCCCTFEMILQCHPFIHAHPCFINLTPTYLLLFKPFYSIIISNLSKILI